GPIKTASARGIPGFSDMANMAAERSPLGKVFSPEHVAGTAVFLASDASAGITGDIIFVDGGYHATGMYRSPSTLVAKGGRVSGRTSSCDNRDPAHHRAGGMFWLKRKMLSGS